MRSATPKVLHPLCGRPMVLHVVDALGALPLERIVVVVGHGAERVTKTLQDQLVTEVPVEFVEQRPAGHRRRRERRAHRVRRRPRRRGRHPRAAGRRAAGPPRDARPARHRAPRVGRRRDRSSPPSSTTRRWLRPGRPRHARPRRPHRRADRRHRRRARDRRDQHVDLLLPPQPARARAAPAEPRERAGRVLPDRRDRGAPRGGPPGRRGRGRRPGRGAARERPRPARDRRGGAPRADQRALDARRRHDGRPDRAPTSTRRSSSSPTCGCCRARSSRAAPSSAAGAVVGPDSPLVDTVVRRARGRAEHGGPRVRDRRRLHGRPVRLPAAGHAPRRRRARRHVRRDQERRDRRGRQGAAPRLRRRRRDRRRGPTSAPARSPRTTTARTSTATQDRRPTRASAPTRACRAGRGRRRRLHRRRVGRAPTTCRRARSPRACRPRSTKGGSRAAKPTTDDARRRRRTTTDGARATPRSCMLFAGRGNRELAEEIAREPGRPARRRHALDVRERRDLLPLTARTSAAPDVFVFQTHADPINDRIMEQLIMIDAAKRASAKRITAVCPFYGYSRQDRKAEGREPITARLLADLLTAAGADRVVDRRPAHRPDPGLLRLPGRPPHRGAAARRAPRDDARPATPVTVVAPDAGGGKLARRFANCLDGHSIDAELAFIDKRRPEGHAQRRGRDRGRR